MTSLTYADYASLPNDGRRYELIRGRLVEVRAPGVVHQRVLARLASLLMTHVRERELGEILVSPLDVILSDDSTVQPDIVFVASDRAHLTRGRGVVGSPTLVVEVLSPFDSPSDLEHRADLYLEHRVPHVWIVDPRARTVRSLTLGPSEFVTDASDEGAAVATLRPFPRLTIFLGEIWSEELPD